MKSSFFLKMFPKESPIQSLIEHAALLEKAANLLPGLMRDYFDGKSIEETVRTISDLESQADEIKFKIRKMLSSTVRTPFAVKDILDYLHLQDSLIDSVEDIAKKLCLNKVEGLDDHVKGLTLELVDQVKDSIDFLEDMMREVKSVISSSFAEKVLEKEGRGVIKIEDIEFNVDKLSIDIGKWLYSKKYEMNPVDLIFFRETVRIMVKMTDTAENTAELMHAFLK